MNSRNGTPEIEVYMDTVDWQHEIGAASDGNRVFPSTDDLKKWSKCWRECGIVKVKVSFVEVAEPQNLHRDEDDNATNK